MVQRMMVFVGGVSMLHGASAARVDQLILGDVASEAEHFIEFLKTREQRFEWCNFFCEVE